MFHWKKKNVQSWVFFFFFCVRSREMLVSLSLSVYIYIYIYIYIFFFLFCLACYMGQTDIFIIPRAADRTLHVLISSYMRDKTHFRISQHGRQISSECNTDIPQISLPCMAVCRVAGLYFNRETALGICLSRGNQNISRQPHYSEHHKKVGSRGYSLDEY